jgi:phosphinothricin acetyltransferase
MKSSLQIRPATRADLPAITTIYAHAVIHGAASYEYDPPSLAEMTARFDALTEAGYPFLVAERVRSGTDKEVLGYAYGSAFRTRPAYRFTLEDSIYLAPEAQGQGIGRQLLGELIQRCQELGFRQMIAVIGDGAVSLASVRLHEGLGFTHAGRILGSGFKHDRWCDTVLMQLAMNGGTTRKPDPNTTL